MPKIVIYYAQGNNRSLLVAQAMLHGARRIGLEVSYRPSHTYRGRPDHDVAVFYGLSDRLRDVFRDYRLRDRKAIYIDLGYFGRRQRSRWDGYHKLVCNDRHPTAYFQSRLHQSDRFDSFNIPIQPWRTTSSKKSILVVGMSAKAAAAEGLEPQQWEREAIGKLLKLTRRPIIYRPKPNWDGAKPIAGSIWGGRDTPLDRAFPATHAVVARHSNVAVDALLAGIPCICPHGAASRLAGHDLAEVENPLMPNGREQWAADLAFTQYSMAEMAEGTAWKYLLREGLI